MKSTDRGLIIQSPHIDNILGGEKVWEIRGSKNKNIGKIALIKSGTGKIHGNCDLIKFKGPLSKQELRDNQEKHQVKDIDKVFCIYRCKPYAWVLDNYKEFETSIPFDRKQGQVIWVDLSDHGRKDEIFAEPNKTKEI